MSDVSRSRDYQSFVETLKERVRAAQVRAALSVNQELVLLYWGIGKDILARQEELGWGAKVIKHLSRDLKAAFPEMKGFSARNLELMRSFAEAYEDEAIAKQVVSQIPWGHNIRLLQKVKDPQQRLWYVRKVIEHGWSRNVLTLQIESDLYGRQGSAPTNFARTLPVDDLLRHETDQPTVGILLCKSKDDVLVEYALRDMTKPIGVAGWETRLVESPEELEGSLPTVEQLEAELSKDPDE